MKSYNMIPFLELLGPPDLYHGSAGALLGVEGVVWSEECSGGCRSKIPGCKLSFWREVWKEISCVPCSFCCHVILISWWTGSEHLSWRCDRDPKWLRYWGFVSQLNVNGIITMLVHLRKMIKAKRAQCSVSCSEWLDISIMLCCNQLSRWWGEGSLPSWRWVLSVEGWSQILSQWILIEDQQFHSRCFQRRRYCYDDY